MPVQAVVMRHAVLQTLRPMPPPITVFVSIFGTVKVALLNDGRIVPRRIVSQTRQRTVGAISTQKAVYTIRGTISIEAYFVALVVTSVMASLIVILRDAEHRAVLAKPSFKTRLTSVMRTVVMSVIDIVVRNAVCLTLGTKPPR